MKQNDVDSLYKQAWNYMKSSTREVLDLDDKVYRNLISAVYVNIRDNKLYCDDIMFNCVDRYLSYDSKCDGIEPDRGSQLIENIIQTLELNKKTHYLLIPFNGGRLEEDISFGNYNFIIGDEEVKLSKIVGITGYNEFDIKMFIEHTKKSRSKDFMKYPMLVMKVENIHNNVYFNAAYISKLIFKILKLIVYYDETDKDIFEMTTNWYKDNYHVAIIGEESWQYGHGNWWNLINFKYSLDFLKDNDSQVLFEKLVDVFIWDKNNDELHNKFANALELFEKSLEQEENYKDTTLSYMLLFSAAESLLTEGKNEKKLRLSIIWPRLVEISGISQKDLGVMIRDKYDLRNDFVHAGNIFQSEERDDLRTLHQMLAKLIMKYVYSESWTEEKTIMEWKAYVEHTFDDAVYS